MGEQLETSVTLGMRSGAIGGLLSTSLGLGGMAAMWLLTLDTTALSGFGSGASLVSFYLRVGGGIFSKGAEIGADLVGEMAENKLDEERRVYELQQRMAEMESLRLERRKKGLNEEEEDMMDQLRMMEEEMEDIASSLHPLDYLDAVGENICDVSGACADLFESMVLILSLSLIIGARGSAVPYFFTSLPLWIVAAGNLACTLVAHRSHVRNHFTSRQVRWYMRLNLLFMITFHQLHVAMPLFSPAPRAVGSGAPMWLVRHAPMRWRTKPRYQVLRRTAAAATATAAAAAVPAVWPARRRTKVAGGPALLEALQRDGFVRVELSGHEEQILEKALTAFAEQKSFRYPPVPGELEELEDTKGPVMTKSYAEAFDLLYGIACTAALLMQGEQVVKSKLKPCEGREPFSCEGPWHFSSSFFNIFNYDHGCLNAHRDRGVLTVVYGAPSDHVDATRLWVRHVDGPLGIKHWLAPESGLLLWAGEGFQHAQAVEHCVRMHPEGDYVEHSHSRRDPEAPLTGNRRSVALILDD
eukprot:symbB.v1.2.001486.t1/scaffold48.1/size388161/19